MRLFAFSLLLIVQVSINAAFAQGYGIFQIEKNGKTGILIPSFHDRLTISRSVEIQNSLERYIKTSEGVCLEADKKQAALDVDDSETITSKTYFNTRYSIDKYISVENIPDITTLLGIPNEIRSTYLSKATPLDFMLRAMTSVPGDVISKSPDPALDDFVVSSAKINFKNIRYLEEIGEVSQHILDSFDNKNEWAVVLNSMINYAACPVCQKKYFNVNQKMHIEVIRNGNYDLAKKYFDEAGQITGEYFVYSLVLGVKRNRDFIKKINKYIDSNECSVFAIGASHFGGAFGIEKIAKVAGFKVEKVLIE